VARPIFKLLTGFCLAAVVVAALVVAMELLKPAPQLPPLPRPNGFDEFAAAGKMIVGDASAFPTMTTNELRAFVAQNAEALKLARTGLTHQCRVPVVYSQTNMDFVERAGAIRQLALALATQGRLAESEGRTGDAAKDYLTVMRIGQESCRGGLIINSLVSVAVEAIGTVRLEQVADKLDAAQCAELASTLRSAESRREPLATILAQEREWGRRTFGIKGQIQWLISFKSLRAAEQRWMAKATAQQNRTANLIARLASRAHELDEGKPPQEKVIGNQ